MENILQAWITFKGDHAKPESYADYRSLMTDFFKQISLELTA